MTGAGSDRWSPEGVHCNWCAGIYTLDAGTVTRLTPNYDDNFGCALSYSGETDPRITADNQLAFEYLWTTNSVRRARAADL
jgi:hypothetical protein